MAIIQHITTAEQLLDAPDLGRCELRRGELIMMSPAGFEHGRIVGRISARLVLAVEEAHLGVVTGAETGFWIHRSPDTVRAPDVGFVVAARIPDEPIPGFFPGPPDIAVEVLSPTDRASEVFDKVQDWLTAGCRLVWVVDPSNRTILAYRMQDSTIVAQAVDELCDEELVPEFHLRAEDVFTTGKVSD